MANWSFHQLGLPVHDGFTNPYAENSQKYAYHEDDHQRHPGGAMHPTDLLNPTDASGYSVLGLPPSGALPSNNSVIHTIPTGVTSIDAFFQNRVPYRPYGQVATLPTPSTLYKLQDPDDDEEPGDKHLTQKQKTRRRASQNLASRNYRQRKKEYLTDVESRLEKLSIDNERLRRESNENRLLASKLLRENAELKKADAPREAQSAAETNDDLLNSELDLKLLIDKLDAAVSSGTDDKGLSELLKVFFNTLHRRHNIFTNQIKEIVNPCMQAKISILDAEPTPILPTEPSEQEKASGSWWINFKAEAKITDEQDAHITHLRGKHSQLYQQVGKERVKLNKEIKDFFHRVFSSNGQLMGGALEPQVDCSDEPTVKALSMKFEALKKNLETEKFLTLSSHEALAEILTPMQEAMLVTRTYSNRLQQASSMQMLSFMWDKMSKKENALSRCCTDNWFEDVAVHL